MYKDKSPISNYKSIKNKIISNLNNIITIKLTLTNR